MPVVVREVNDAVWHAVGVRHLNWTVYRQVHGTSPEQTDLLNYFGPVFCSAVQDSMLDGAFLAIHRLTGPQ